MSVEPIFLLGISRSGTTLLQRMLAAHSEIASASEPFLLVPLLASMDRESPTGGAWHGLTSLGITEFTERLPDHLASYQRAVREFAIELYAAATPGDERYFVDKTPIYWTVVAQLLAVFPNAKFVFLWRNPLSVIASCVQTWSDSRWRINDYRSDWFAGLPALLAAYNSANERAVSLRFEDLVAHPAETLERLCEYLEIGYLPEMTSAFAQIDLGGSLGDPTGVNRYRSASLEPLDKWRACLGTPIRRAWCQSYLRWLGSERLRVMGYDLSELQGQLDEIDVRWRSGPADARSLVALAMHEIVKARLDVPSPPSSWRRILS